MAGWIKLHRSMTEWEWYSDHNTTRLFIHLMMKANHADNKWQGVDIPSGSLVTGLNSLRLQTGLSVSQLRTSLKKLKSTGEIAIKATNKHSMISINNWSLHQVDDKPDNKRVTNKSQTDDKQIATNKNDKKEKNKYSDEFESAWKSFGGTGTKTIAYRFWQKLSQADKDSVVSRMPAYVASEPDERYRGHFSSWINPDKRKWENKLKVDESTESTEMTPEQEKELFKDYC